jgi:hypothetical protein
VIIFITKAEKIFLKEGNLRELLKFVMATKFSPRVDSGDLKK